MSIIERQFSKSAPFYDQYAHAQRYAFDRLMERVAQQYPNTSPQRVLDIGCGTGFHTALFSNVYPEANCVGQDIATDMIQWATTHYGSERLQFDCVSLHALSLTEPVDLVISNAAFQWFQDLSSDFVCIKALMQPQGKLLFSAFGPNTYHELKQVLSTVMGKPALLASSSFLTPAQTESILRQQWATAILSQERVQRSYASVHELLRVIKLTGTRGEGLQEVQWTPGFLKEVERVYRALYGQILVTYDMMYGVAYE